MITREQLEQLASMIPTATEQRRPRTERDAFDLEAWMRAHADRLHVVKTKPWNGGRVWIMNPCPWNADHTNDSAFMVQFANGAIAARCHHNSCAGKDWRALRALVDPDAERSRRRGGEGHSAGEPGDPAQADDRVGQQPQIDARNLDLPDVTSQAWDALLAANEPPTMFRVGNLPVRLESDDEGGRASQPLNQDRLRHHLARVAEWVTFDERGDPHPALPPMYVVRDMLARPDPPLPLLTRIVGAPVYAADGTLLDTPGYHPAAQLWYAPAPGLEIPDVADEPSSADVGRARALLLDDLLVDFPFVGGAERAHALALLLLPFVREMIDGRTPLHLVEKPTPGSGAGLLVRVLALPALGHPPALMTEGRDEDEWRKRVTAKLIAGPAMVFIDNLRRRLDSAALSAAITAPVWEDRVLGHSRMVRTRVRCAWVATGNNPALSNEMARRTVRIRLDPKVDRPWLREGFKHDPLGDWAAQHRGELIWAALTLVRAWLAAGRPAGRHLLGEFEAWSRVMGGVLDVAGIPGLLGNLEDFYEASDAEGAAIRAFLHAWWEKHGSTEVGVEELFPLAMSDGVEVDLDAKTERGQRTQLGHLLRDKLRDRRSDLGEDLVVEVKPAGKRRRASRWRLIRHEGPEKVRRGSPGSPPAVENVPPSREPVGEPLVRRPESVSPPNPVANQAVTDSVNLGEPFSSSARSPGGSYRKPTEPCQTCGSRRFWLRSTDKFVACSTCYPPLWSFVEASFEVPSDGQSFERRSVRD